MEFGLGEIFQQISWMMISNDIYTTKHQLRELPLKTLLIYQTVFCWHYLNFCGEIIHFQPCVFSLSPHIFSDAH